MNDSVVEPKLWEIQQLALEKHREGCCFTKCYVVSGFSGVRYGQVVL